MWGVTAVAAGEFLLGAPACRVRPGQWAVVTPGKPGMRERHTGVVMNRHRRDAPGTIPGAPSRPLPKRQQVEETIEAIRPALQADGGDIVRRDVDEATGVVSVTLVGACGTCPASTQTLKAGIERIMRDRVDGVTEVVAV